MNGRSLFILALAVAIGLGAMILTRQMLSAQQEASRTKTRRRSWSPLATSRKRNYSSPTWSR